MNKKLLKLSAKYSFRQLREYSPYYSEALTSDIVVNRQYWEHLNFTKERTREETEERLFLSPLIRTVLQYGKTVSAQYPFIRIEYTLENTPLGCMIIQKGEKYILLSSFIVKRKKSNLPPV